MKFILGKKLVMTRVFQEDGKVVPVTLVEAGPVTVTRIKTKDADGYEAVQVGYEEAKRPTKPVAGQTKSLGAFKKLREFRTTTVELKTGDVLNVGIFAEGDRIKVSSVSKGKGFQGGMKRHGFHGMPASHGHKHVKRHAGSIGQRFPQHTLKGTRMAGHMGVERVTVRGLRVVKIDTDKNLLAVKGAVPGRRGTLLEIVTY